MTWTELTQRRTQTAKHWRNTTTGKARFEQILKTPLHYRSAGPDSRLFDAPVVIDLRRTTANQFDGWIMDVGDFHYGLGIPTTAYPGQDGWFFVGGRQRSHVLGIRLHRLGYLHWPTKAFTALGGAPDYDRANLSRASHDVVLGPQGFETSITASTTAAWANVFPGVEMRIAGDGLKLSPDFYVSETARNNIPAPATPAAETLFCGVYKLHTGRLFGLPGINRWLKNGVLTGIDDVDDGDGGLFHIEDDAGNLLARLTPDFAYSDDGLARVRLRKRIYTDGSNTFLLIGAWVPELNSLPAGGVLFDPTFSDQPDETSAKDTYLNEGATTTNYGTDAVLAMGAESGSFGRSTLIEFDCSSIPGTATCDSATLSLWSAESKSAQTFDIYSLHANRADWVEAEATWNIYKTGNNWTTAGAASSGNDYEADASPPTITFPNSSIDTEATADLTSGSNLTAARIAGWFGASNTNYGINAGVTGSTIARSWHSPNNGTASLRPKFVAEYTEAATTTTTTTTTTLPPPSTVPTFVQSRQLTITFADPQWVDSRKPAEEFNNLETYQHEIRDIGGYYNARITIKDRLENLEDWLESGLGRHIETYNPAAETIWEGFVNKITLSDGIRRQTLGPLLAIANKIKVVYSTIDTTTEPPTTGIRTETAFASNAESQALYGTIEKAISSGGETATSAAQIRDSELNRPTVVFPALSGDANLQGSGQLSIDLEVLGYWHWLDTYYYANTGVTGDENLSTKIQNILAAVPDGLFSTDYSKITANTTQLPQYEEGNRKALKILEDMPDYGDASNNNYVIGFYRGRRLHYEQIPSQVEYLRYLTSNLGITDILGQRVDSWDVLPNRWIFYPDTAIGRHPPVTLATLRTDPRVGFIQVVKFTAPGDVSFSSGPVGQPDKLLKRQGLE